MSGTSGVVTTAEMPKHQVSVGQGAAQHPSVPRRALQSKAFRPRTPLVLACRLNRPGEEHAGPAMGAHVGGAA